MVMFVGVKLVGCGTMLQHWQNRKPWQQQACGQLSHAVVSPEWQCLAAVSLWVVVQYCGIGRTATSVGGKLMDSDATPWHQQNGDVYLYKSRIPVEGCK